MKKLLLILLCVPLMFSCGENEKDENKGECVSGDCENREGTYTFSDGENGGCKYVGQWKNGKEDGKGVKRCGGYEYIGEFKNGKYHGQGTYTWETGPNKGDKYVGQWKDDKMHGQGTVTWAGGCKYVGEFRDGNMNGQGTFTYDGTIKKGLWIDGEFLGEE